MKSGYALFHCDACGLYQTDLKKEYESFVKSFYGKGYFTGDPTRGAYTSYRKDKPYITKNMRRFLAEVKKHKPTGKLLDAGCAYGYFVELALDSGYDAYGFDPSSHAAAEARKIVGKTRIKEGTIGSVRYPGEKFDIITLFDVFEHLSDPKGDVEKLTKLLAPGGILVIATGDTDSAMAKTLKRKWTFFNPPQHLFFFNQKNLTRLLAAIRMKPVHWFRIGKWLSLEYVFHLAETGAESSLGKFLHKSLGPTVVGRMPIYLPLMDNMVVIAKKKV